MLNTIAEVRDTRRMLESRRQQGYHSYREALLEIGQLRRGGEIPNWSVRTLYEELVVDCHGDPCGREAVRMMEQAQRDPGSQTFFEAGGDAIVTADFSNIMGQITYSDVLQAMEMPGLIAGQLMTEKPATTSQREIIPGVSMIGDKGQDVGENEDYPLVGLRGIFIVTPEKVKNGFMMEITEETVAEDKTGMIVEHMMEASKFLAVGQEKERLQTILGITTSFTWGTGEAQATYANSFTGFDLDNLIASNPLVDYTNLDVVDNAFSETVDPTTGEPVVVAGQMDLVLPRALRNTGRRIVSANEVRVGNVATGGGVQTIGANPLTFEDSDYRPLSSPYVSSITGSDSTYFAGLFREAFEDRVIWPLGMYVEDGNSGKKFERDLVTRLKVRRKSAPTVRAPWKVKKITI